MSASHIAVSVHRSVSICVCCVILSPWFTGTCAYSQHFWINVISQSWDLGSATLWGNDADWIRDVEGQGDIIPSDCYLWLCGKRLLVLRSNSTPYHGANEGACSSSRECILNDHNITCHETLRSISCPTKCLEHDIAWMSLWNLYMILAAIAGCFTFVIMFVPKGYTCEVSYRGTPVLSTGTARFRTYSCVTSCTAECGFSSCMPGPIRGCRHEKCFRYSLG